jgi:PAS domain S-box-containing protein
MFTVVARDITERKRSEADLRTQKELIDRILATMPNAVLVLSKDLRIVLSNRAFNEAFEMKKHEVEGKRLDDILPVEELCQAVSKVLTGKELNLQFDFRHEVAGHDKVLVASVIPMQKNEALLILNDVTDERERQERLYLTDRLASVGEMASGVAHELNNPLTGVITMSQLLAEDDMSDDAKENVEAITREAKRAVGVVKNLLTFARKHTPVRQLAQINNIIEDVLQLRAYEHKVNNVQIDTRFASELPEIMVDYFQMQQVFLNIILNAEYAMIEAHKQGALTITTERFNSNIKVTFTDDGPGINQKDLARLFDPFFTTKVVGKGTGLGLSICYGIVTGHSGKIYAQSEMGSGATFVVELPISSY